MIQRIQSIMLAGVVLLGIVAVFFPILSFSGYGVEAVMSLYKTVLLEDKSAVIAKNMGVGVMQGVILLVALLTIFLFKKRQLQIKLAKLTILLIALEIAAIVMYVDAVKSAIGPQVTSVMVSFNVGAVIPVLSLVLTYLSIRFIKKDEELIRSADRLR